MAPSSLLRSTGLITEASSLILNELSVGGKPLLCLSVCSLWTSSVGGVED